MLQLINLSTAATLLAIVFVIALRPLAVRLKLVDKPDDRKIHDGEIPLLGGPVIWTVTLLSVLIVKPEISWSIFIASSLLLVLGIFDDRKQVPAIIKLIFHIAAATVIVFGENIAISNIGILSSYWALPELSSLHALLAIVAIVAAINAFNFIDGIDGLCASLAFLALIHSNLAFNILFGQAPSDYVFYSSIVSGALAGFLLFNLQIFNGNKIFLGDSGSMLLGLFVAIAMISATQGAERLPGMQPIPVSLALWLIAIPLTDITSIVIRRLASGRSPMAPDRTHLHHKIMDMGLSARRTLLVMILSAIGAFWIGFDVTTRYGDAASIITFVLFIPVYYFAVSLLSKYFKSALSK